MNTRRALVHWPGLSQFAYGAGLVIAVGLLFAIVYGGTDWLAAQHSWRVRLHLPVDLSVPLVPAAVAVYLSLNPLMWMSLFVLRTRRELQALAATMAGAILVAGVCFLLLPAEEVFVRPSPSELGYWAPWFDFAWTLTRHGNFAPSLHVTFTLLCLAAYWPHAAAGSECLLGGWGLAIIVSTLLTHQHYLVDVLSGGLLAAAVWRVIYRRLLPADPPALARQSVAASPLPDRERPA
jgi:membrane-associated phospholipid phosphatase